MAGKPGFSPYVSFSREEWSRLRLATPLTLSEGDLAKLHGLNERVSLDEVVEVYLPLSRLLNLYVAATQDLFRATDTFLGGPATQVPFIIGIAGSVAVGKSTTARILQALLARWPNHPRVDLVTTDGFLFPNQVLIERGLLGRKGFPESYDVRRLIRFMADVKSGKAEVAVPVYSHLSYDIVPDQFQVLSEPDVVIVEGLNVLQTGPRPSPGGVLASRPLIGLPLLEEPAAPAASATAAVFASGADSAGASPAGSAGPSPARPPIVFVSDFFDFSIYVDADEEHIRNWYVDRFVTLVETAFRNPQSYFHRYSTLTVDEAVLVAEHIWRDINSPNLRENILPTRERARLVLRKDPDHGVREVRLRKI